MHRDEANITTYLSRFRASFKHEENIYCAMIIERCDRPNLKLILNAALNYMPICPDSSKTCKFALSGSKQYENTILLFHCLAIINYV